MYLARVVGRVVATVKQDTITGQPLQFQPGSKWRYGSGVTVCGHIVEVVDAVPPEDVLSINTPRQLAEVDAILTARLERRS